MLQEKTKNSGSKKKKLYHPFANDQDYYFVDEKLPIEIKSRIPHWVPSKNADIFEVRKVLTSENEQIRNLNRSVGVYKVENEIVISKNIKEEESKKLNKRINRDIANDLIIQEKIKNKNNRYFISENKYNFLSKLNGSKNSNNWTFQTNRDRSFNHLLTESNLNTTKQIMNGEHCYNPINTDLNTLKNESSIFKVDKSKKFDFIGNSREILPLRRDLSAQELKLNPIKNRNGIANSGKKISSSVSKMDKSIENLKKVEEINLNNSVLITSLANQTSPQVDEFFRNKLKKDYKNKFETNTLHELKEEKEDFENNILPIKEKKKDNKKNRLANSAAIFEPPITSSMRCSVREYINKTREVVLLRHSVEIKKETTLKMEENYKNQVESLTESIVSLRQAKELFEEDFILRFDRYVKFLRLQREKELSELHNILDKKSQLELEIQKLENKKSKSKEFVRLFREYRDFLICVKERTTNLPKFFLENENYQNNNVISLEYFIKNKNYKNAKFLMCNSNDPTIDELTGELGSNLDERERKKISIDMEKREKTTNMLMDQLNYTQNYDVIVLDYNNLSPNSKNNENSEVINSVVSNNLKSPNTQIVNTNSNLNTHTNSHSKIQSAISYRGNNKGNNIQNSKLNIGNILTESNVNNTNASNININSNINLNDSRIQFNNKTEKMEILNTTLIDVDPSLIKKFNDYISKPIYETPDDLNEDIKKLQLENINLLKKLTATAAKVNILKQNTQKLIKENNNEINLLQIEVNQRISNLKELQEMNKSLLEEKSFLLGNLNGYNNKPISNSDNLEENYSIPQNKNNNKKSLVKSKFNEAILYSKINEIFLLTLEIHINANINKEMNFSLSLNKSNFNIYDKISENTNKEKNLQNSHEIKNKSIINKNYQIDRDSNLMFMLKIIEKSIDFLLARQDSYTKDSKKKIQLEKIRIDLEKERKVTKAIEARLKDEKRREVLNQAIIERNSRPIILPKRRYGEKPKPVEKNNTSRSINIKKEE